MPNLVFLGMAAACAAGAFFLSKRKESDKAAAAAPAAAAATPSEQRELSWDDVEPVDLIGLEVGYRLIPLVDRNQGGELMGRIKGVRKKLSEELGFLVQAVHIRDNLELGPNSYQITILGAPVGESEVFPDRELAINPGQVSGTVPGSATKDPAFGLDAIWIEKPRREQAQGQGYTVVRQQRHRDPFESFAAIACARAAGPRGSSAIAQSLEQERTEADRGPGAEASADERRRQGAAVPAARAGADPQSAHHL
jgi:flagellar biosynthesis protein FlhA